jgi:hypothetical protein
MSYLDRQKDQYHDILKLIDKKMSKGKGIKSLRKSIVKRLNQLEYLIEHR